MDLIKYEGSYVGKELIDSLGTMVEVTFIPYQNELHVEMSDAMYNNSAVHVKDQPSCSIQDKKARMENVELQEGDLIQIIPPGGFPRIIHIHLDQGA